MPELGARFRDYRLCYNKTQKGIARTTVLPIFSISIFENGTAVGITMLTFLQLLRAIDEFPQVEKFLSELPAGPGCFIRNK